MDKVYFASTMDYVIRWLFIGVQYVAVIFFAVILLRTQEPVGYATALLLLTAYKPYYTPMKLHEVKAENE